MNEPVTTALHSYSRRLRFVHEPGYDVFAFIDEASRRGFDGVNISLSGPDNDALPPHRHLGGGTPAHLAAVAAALEERALSIEIDTDSVDPRRLREALTIARPLGARVLRTFTHYAGDGALDRTVRDLRTVAAAAETAGVVIAVENHEEFESGELVTLVDDVGSSHVQLLFDYGNSLPVLERPEDALDAMLPHVAACHVKDVVMVAAEDSPDGVPAAMGVPLGAGNLPIERLTGTLVASGLRRFALQNVWGYHVPLGRLRAVDVHDPRLGHHDFAYRRSPFEPEVVIFDPESHRGPNRLVELETAALDVATTHLRRIVERVN